MWKKPTVVFGLSALLLSGCNFDDDVPGVDETPMDDVRENTNETPMEDRNNTNPLDDAGQNNDADLMPGNGDRANPNDDTMRDRDTTDDEILEDARKDDMNR